MGVLYSFSTKKIVYAKMYLRLFYFCVTIFRTLLNLPARCISESFIKTKINLNLIFTLLCGASIGFMKAFKTFIKPFEATQKKCENKNLT